MALPIRFTQERMAYLLSCLAKGKAIEPETESGWTNNDMLALAGACFFGVVSQGPITTGAPRYVSDQRDEFNMFHFKNDIISAIEFYSQVAMAHEEDYYHDHFEEKVEVSVESRGGRLPVLTLAKGVKNSGLFRVEEPNSD